MIGCHHVGIRLAIEVDIGRSRRPVRFLTQSNRHGDAELVQQMNEAFCAEPGGAAADELRDLRLRDAHDLAGLDLGEAKVSG